MAYVDTSVMAAYYCPESLSAKAQEAIGKYPKPLISQLVEVELCSAMSLKVRTGEIDARSAAMVIRTFRSHLSEGIFRIIAIDARQYEMARDWLATFDTPLRTLDALHLATAFTHKQTVLTADKIMAQAARQLGVSCKLIS